MICPNAASVKLGDPLRGQQGNCRLHSGPRQQVVIRDGSEDRFQVTYINGEVRADYSITSTGLTQIFRTFKDKLTWKNENAELEDNVNTDKEIQESYEPDENPLTLTQDDLGVNGVKCGDSSDKVVEVFGQPLSVSQREIQEGVQSIGTLVYWDTWVYEGIEFLFYSWRYEGEPEPDQPEHLYLIRITGSQYETLRGIRIGDSLQAVFEKYGVRKQYQTEQTVIRYEGYNLEIIEFSIHDGKISEISLISSFS